MKNVKGIALWISILWVIVGILIIIFPLVLNWLLGIALIAVGVLTYFSKK